MAIDPPTPDLLELVAHTTCVRDTERMEDVYSWLRENQEHEYLGVVDGHRLVGLISRGHIGWVLGSKYGTAIHGRSPVADHLLPRHLQIEHGTPIIPALEMTFARPEESFHDDVALVDPDGGFMGLISVQTLVRLQNRILNERVKLSQVQQQALTEKNAALAESLEELKRSRGRYDILFQNAALGVALLNRRGEIETLNDRLLQLIPDLAGHQGEPLELARLVAPGDRDTFRDVLRTLSAQSRPVPVERDVTVELAGQEAREFRFFVNRVRETDQFCLCVEDLTEARNLERQLIRNEKSALINSLVGGIAHELNNKLAPVVGFSEILMQKAAAQEDHSGFRRPCEIIRDSALESGKIIRQLLQLSKPVQADLRLTDISAVVQDALDFLHYQLREAGISLHWNPPATSVETLVDPPQLKQVVMNLVMNAIDAMAGTSMRRLSVNLSDQAGVIELAVQDTGIGIAPEHLSRIFDPFFTTKGPDKGTGLGLAVCFSIIKQFGGEVTAESTIGKGTTFRIALRSHRSARKAAPAVAPATNLLDPAGPSSERDPLSILVVDDEEHVALLACEALESHLDCTVERSEDGATARQRLEESHFDLIISDVRMPEMNGVELYEWVRDHRPELTRLFFFITGDTGSNLLKQRIEEYQVPVLLKPFTISGLINQCQTMLQEESASKPEETKLAER